MPTCDRPIGGVHSNAWRSDAFFVTGRWTPKGTKLVRVALASGDQTVVGTLYTSDRDGANPRELAQLEGRIGPIRVTPEHVYYWDDDAGVTRVPKAGGAPQVVVAFNTDESFGFDVVGEHVYWTSSDGTLSRSPTTPGAGATELLEQRGSFDDDDYRPLLEVDARRVYWQAGPVAGEG